jgi:hypothetical protein
VIGIHPTRRERSIRAHEQPHIAIARDAHQEGRHGVDILDLGVALAIDGDEAAADPELIRTEQRLGRHERVVSRRHADSD